MRTQTHDRVINFRAPSSLLAEAEELARRERMSLAELLRAAVREKVREAA